MARSVEARVGRLRCTSSGTADQHRNDFESALRTIVDASLPAGHPFEMDLHRAAVAVHMKAISRLELDAAKNDTDGAPSGA